MLLRHKVTPATLPGADPGATNPAEGLIHRGNVARLGPAKHRKSNQPTGNFLQGRRDQRRV